MPSWWPVLRLRAYEGVFDKRKNSAFAGTPLGRARCTELTTTPQANHRRTRGILIVELCEPIYLITRFITGGALEFYTNLVATLSFHMAF